MRDLRDLLGRPAAAADLTPTEAAAALVEVATITVALAARVQAAPEAAVPPTDAPDDMWITTDEAARLAGVSRRVVYGWSRRRDWSRFTARPSRKVLRIKRAAFEQWLATTGSEYRR